MTAAYADAENALGKEIVRLEGLIALRDVVREVGSMLQAADEAGKRLAAAQADEATARDQLDAIEQKVVAAQSAAAIEIATASTAADDVLTKAKVAAAAIIAGARAESERIIVDAAARTAESTRKAALLATAIAQAGT
jgi:cell division septum initiation protein DivIVA